jgi:hypothetical protein
MLVRNRSRHVTLAPRDAGHLREVYPSLLGWEASWRVVLFSSLNRRVVARGGQPRGRHDLPSLWLIENSKLRIGAQDVCEDAIQLRVRRFSIEWVALEITLVSLEIVSLRLWRLSARRGTQDLPGDWQRAEKRCENAKRRQDLQFSLLGKIPGASMQRRPGCSLH